MSSLITMELLGDSSSGEDYFLGVFYLKLRLWLCSMGMFPLNEKTYKSLLIRILILEKGTTEGSPFARPQRSLKAERKAP